MRRFLHAVPEAPAFAGQSIVRATPAVDPRVPQSPAFRVLGLGSMLEVQLPPSVELIARRNAITGVLSSSSPASSLISKLGLARSPFLRLLGRQPVLHQTVVGSQPLTCLVGSENRFLTAVDLDGTKDWVIRSPVEAYVGKQLQFSARSGWRPGAPPFTHTIAAGRGKMCLSTPASPVQFSVPAGESVLVQKAHLSAYTADTNASHRSASTTQISFTFSNPTVAEPVLPAIEPSRWEVIRSKIAQAWRAMSAWVAHYTRSGNSAPYIEIYGPSTVLVSSASKPPRLQSRQQASGQPPAATSTR